MADEIRIGAFICHCGHNIGGFLDVPAVADYAAMLPNVTHAEANLYTCAEDGLSAIKDAIQEYKLNRVVVASCTPRTHAPLFQRTCEEAGLNKYLFTFVNIREHCSWVHMKEKEKATQKAKDLVRAGIARAALLEPKEDIHVDVTKKAIVLGGGVAGMSAALSLANQGFPTILVEREKQPGGFLLKLNALYQTSDAPDKFIEDMVKKVQANKNIQLFTESTLSSLEGFIGNYKVTLDTPKGAVNDEVGTIVVATGAKEYKPEGLYGYGQSPNVVTLTELEGKMRDGKMPEKLNRVAFIQCVGARGQDKTYCSRYCCTTAIKDAMKLLEMYGGVAAAPVEADSTEERPARRTRVSRRRAAEEAPAEAAAAEDEPSGGIEVTIFNRGITTYGIEHELLYNKSRAQGVRYTRFVPDNIPKVTPTDGGLKVEYYHPTLQADRSMDVDMVVLSAPLEAQDGAKELSKMLKVPLGQEGFFLEAHVKLRPVEFATDGIYLCGTCHGPADITESVEQALGAASRASIPLDRGYVQAEAITSMVDEDKCTGCGTCEEMCPYGAIVLNEEGIAQVVAAACKGCGACGSVCPEHAITMQSYTDEQLLAEATAVLKEAA